jgi:LETM1 and EF-hand domain-containing protein 1, mitochondrial
MRAVGLNTFGYRKQMKEWLDLSMQKQVPISLLIMSRAFVLRSTEVNRAHYTAEETVKTALTALEDDLVNEVIIQSARSEEATSMEMKQRKLESISYQNEVMNA